MAIAYDGINYFPVGVNFMEENTGVARKFVRHFFR